MIPGKLLKKYGSWIFGLGNGALLCGLVPVSAGEFVLNRAEQEFFHATAMDQPRLYGLLTDADGAVMEDDFGPVYFRAFIDTGSSSFVISNLHATGDFNQRPFGFVEDDFVDEYTNLGLGGEEVGSVTREFGIRLLNQPELSVELDDFVDYGSHRLWVRKAPGIGEVIEFETEDWGVLTVASPINIIGMPVIEQRTMVMEWLSPEDPDEVLPSEARELQTRLLPKGDGGIPATNVTLDLKMRNFVEASGNEILPSFSKNPLVRDVRISHASERESVTADWLFDTGAGSSFISFDFAQTIGLIHQSYASLDDYLVDHKAADGMISRVGGIGPDMVTVPLLEVKEISVPAREGFDLVWENVRIYVFDHPELAELGLEGIFGMNMIGPSATVDASLLGDLGFDEEAGTPNSDILDLLFAMLSDITPAAFETIVFEVTGEETAELRFFTDRELPAAHESISFDSWRESQFGADAGNDAISGPLADPGDYGLKNLLRYGFAMEGPQPQRTHLPAVTGSPNTTGGGPVLEFQRFRNVVGVTYRVEYSADLGAWETAEEVTWETTPIDTERESVSAQVHDPLPAKGAFFRVVVEKVD